jgi:hypothetical protein
LRDERQYLIDLVEEAKARGVSVQQLEADRNKQPPPTGLVSDFGYAPITHPGDTTVLTWDPDDDRRRTAEAKRRAIDARRRALVSEGLKVEYFTRQEIINRDDSTCHICRKRCDRSEIHLDHVIPLALGGHHTRDNVRVACASCNLSKGARMPA